MQRMFLPIHNMIKSYYTSRISESKFLVCYKNNFAKDLEGETLESLVTDAYNIPYYSNIYCIEIDESSHFVRFLDYKQFVRTGILCAHIAYVVRGLNTKMIHPRYLKVLNSEEYEKNSLVREAIDSTIKYYRNHTKDGKNWCNVQDIFNLSKFSRSKYREGTNEEIRLSMLSLYKIH